MSFLDEYKRLAESETDNEFPEQMEHDGLSESDRDMYEEVLNKMRSDMDKANEEMKKNAKRPISTPFPNPRPPKTFRRRFRTKSICVRCTFFLMEDNRWIYWSRSTMPSIVLYGLFAPFFTSHTRTFLSCISTMSVSI